LSRTKPRERVIETECEMGERAPSLRRERGTRGAPRRQRQDKSAVKRGREEKRERRTWSPGGTPKNLGANGKTRGKRRTTREDESKHKEKRKRGEPEEEKRTSSLRRERGTWWAPALSTPLYGMI
jgi:hypothetical protein